MKTFKKYRFYLCSVFIIIIYGCKTLKSDTKQECYFPSYIGLSKNFTFELDSIKPMPEKLYDFGGEYYNGNIYIFSKTDVYNYNLSSNKWTSINKTPYKFNHVESVLAEDVIYIIGGYGNHNKMYAYNITNNKWIGEYELPLGHYWSTAEYYQGNIYIFGGYHSTRPKALNLNSVYIFNVKTKKWNKGQDIPIAMQTPNSLVYKGDIYVWGGYPEKKCFKYTPKNNKWLEYSKLDSYIKGWQKALVFNNNFLFISGQPNSGKNSKAVKKVFLYDLENCTYTESQSSLNIGRHYNYLVFKHNSNVYILGGREDKDWKPIDNVTILKNIKYVK